MNTRTNITNYDRILQICKENHGIVRTDDLVQNQIPTWYLTDLVNKGKIRRVERGVYATEDGDLDDLYFFQLTHKMCIYSFQCALYLHNMTDRVPYQKEVTVYSGYNASRLGKDVLVHYVRKDKYSVGITRAFTVFNNPVRVYDMERTICDLIINRKEIDPEIYSDALQRFIKSKHRDYRKLREYADIFGIRPKVEFILEVVG